MNKRMRIEKLEEDVKTLMGWKDYFTRETGKLADTVKNLLSALEARETLEKLEDYLNIEMVEEPASKFYRQRKKKEDK
jgi:ribosomal protein L14E/L6E/L27E